MYAEHEGLSILATDLKNEKVHGVLQETEGRLYAVADLDGLDALYDTRKALHDLGISTYLHIGRPDCVLI